jgi:hypothetical protein
MFLPSFEKLRYSILKQHTIESFVQLSNGVFGGDFGSTTCVIGKHCPLNRHGSYFRLVDKTFQLIDTKHLEILFLNALDRREYRFDFSTYDKENPNFDHNPNGQRLYYGNVDQSVYFELPGCQIAYWLSPNLLKCFAYETIKDISISDGQTKTGDNNKYLRMIWEVSSQSVGKCNKWVKHPKGGAYRRWYGNIEWVKLRDLIKLDGRISSFPPQAMICGLAYLKYSKISMRKAVNKYPNFVDFENELNAKLCYSYKKGAETKYGLIVFKEGKNMKKTYHADLLKDGLAKLNRNNELPEYMKELDPIEQDAELKEIGVWDDNEETDYGQNDDDY